MVELQAIVNATHTHYPLRNESCGSTEAGVVHASEQASPAQGVTSMMECCHRCNSAPQCSAWTWVPSTSVNHVNITAMCTLHGGKILNTMRDMDGKPIPVSVFSGKVPKRSPRFKTGLHIYNWNEEVARTQAPPGCFVVSDPWPVITTPKEPVGSQIVAMSFNLEWWSNFDHAKPPEFHYYIKTKENPATRFLVHNGMGLDFLGMQECMNAEFVLEATGLWKEYKGVTGPEGVCAVWRDSIWELVNHDWNYVGEDKLQEFWGRRGVLWVRAKHRENGHHVLFVVHHGPLPINSGGLCGGPALAYGIMKVIEGQQKEGDIVILLGDFNANDGGETIQTLKQHLRRVAQGHAFDGVDNVFTNLPRYFPDGSGTFQGGGSDHDPLQAVLAM